MHVCIAIVLGWVLFEILPMPTAQLTGPGSSMGHGAGCQFWKAKSQVRFATVR